MYIVFKKIKYIKTKLMIMWDKIYPKVIIEQTKFSFTEKSK